MADYTVNIDLPDHKRGDRWPGVAQIGPILIDEATPANNLTRIRMQFRRVRGSGVFTIDTQGTPDAPAIIDDPEEWTAHIPEIQSFLPEAGAWQWDMEFYEQGKAAPLTLYKGVITVHADTTR
jgi:hypothetical protein